MQDLLILTVVVWGFDEQVLSSHDVMNIFNCTLLASRWHQFLCRKKGLSILWSIKNIKWDKVCVCLCYVCWDFCRWILLNYYCFSLPKTAEMFCILNELSFYTKVILIIKTKTIKKIITWNKNKVMILKININWNNQN